ncbi:MAG: glycosyltransferase family 4 protein [Cyanobacteria bacterium J06631_2]
MSADFKPMRGGVAEFSFQIASALNAKGILQAVITPVHQPNPFGLPVIAPSKMNGNGYLGWLSYRLFCLRSIFVLLNHRDKIFFFSYVDELYALPLLKLCMAIGVEFIVLFHGKDILKLSERRKRLLESIFLKSKQLVFNSSATARLFETCTNTKVSESCCIWHPGGRFDYYDQLESHSLAVLESLPEQAILVSSVCRLVKRKGLHFAIQAFNQICLESEFQDIYYIIAGDGTQRKDLEALASLGDKGKIIFLGNITEPQKKALLERSHIFIMPNYSEQGSDFEGFGISFIEAAYFDTVVIGGRSGGAVEALSLCPDSFLIDTDLEDPVPSIKNILSESIRSIQKRRQRQFARGVPKVSAVKQSLRENLNFEVQLESYLKRT